MEEQEFNRESVVHIFRRRAGSHTRGGVVKLFPELLEFPGDEHFHCFRLGRCILHVNVLVGDLFQRESAKGFDSMQPGAQSATTQPRAPLEWGLLNFLRTTDTHGWFEGHIKEPNYGADWGDCVTFSRHIKHKAGNSGVDLLVIDTGDLHDGNGLSDATSPNGAVFYPIFENLDYDLLTIGNHELYITETAYETFNQFSKVYGDRHLTSNVQIIKSKTGQFEYIGSRYRCFTTQHGLRIMAFGVLFDFTGNSNVSKVTKTSDLVKETWFLDAINYPKPIDLFMVIGHNPPRREASTSTFGTLY